MLHRLVAGDALDRSLRKAPSVAPFAESVATSVFLKWATNVVLASTALSLCKASTKETTKEPARPKASISSLVAANAGHPL